VQVMRRGASGVQPRWVVPATYHVTLKFLGWTRPDAVEAVRDRVGAALATARAFEVECRGLGAFPAPDKARVLWAGLDPAGAARLGQLAESIEGAVSQLGFAREKRAYHAHVTLARLKVPGDVRGLISGVSEQTYRYSWVDSVVLFESQMKKEGSEYREICSWALESDSKRPRRHTGPVEHVGEGSEETADGDKHQ
jgi:2'-5' RNA ligase